MGASMAGDSGLIIHPLDAPFYWNHVKLFRLPLDAPIFPQFWKAETQGFPNSVYGMHFSQECLWLVILINCPLDVTFLRETRQAFQAYQFP